MKNKESKFVVDVYVFYPCYKAKNDVSGLSKECTKKEDRAAVTARQLSMTNSKK